MRPTVLLPEPMNPVRQTTRRSVTGPGTGVLDGDNSCKRFRERQSRFRILIVPLKEESSTLAWPSFIVPDRLCPHLEAAGELPCVSGVHVAWLITSPFREVAFTSKESLDVKCSSIVPLKFFMM